MKLRRNLRNIYIAILVILALTTLAGLYDGGYHINGGIIAGLAFASALTSLLPFFISMHLLRKYESNSVDSYHLKVWGMILYFFCFPVKTWIIVSNVLLLINGGDRWAFG